MASDRANDGGVGKKGVEVVEVVEGCQPLGWLDELPTGYAN